MRIDSVHPTVMALTAEWDRCTQPQDSTVEGSVLMSDVLRERLADQILALIASFGGQLILMYHAFLTTGLSGAHSFAHGSEMQSRTVHWMHAARLPVSPEIVRKRSPGSEIECGQQTIRFAPATTYFIPVVWQWVLYPFYPNGGNQLSFGFTKFGRLHSWRSRPEPNKVSVPSADPLDISALGDHLFKTRKVHYDRATTICVVVGNDEVGKWLSEHNSRDAYAQLVNH